MSVTRVLFSVLLCAAWFHAAAGAATRYLSADGDDLNDGLTPATAWRSLGRLNSGLPAGGRALLRCGDVFYGTLEVKGGPGRDRRTVISSYGNGPRPVISGTKNLRPDPALWQSKSARYDCWSIDLTDPTNYTGVASVDANAGFLLVDGEVRPWKRFCRHDINGQWDFASEGGVLYVFSTNNPAILSKDIRVAVNVPGVLLHSHTAISNLSVRAVGGHGVCAGWSETAEVDMLVRDCDFVNIGGSELPGFKACRIRYGNGVEFGSNCADALVERCSFKGIYDVALTMQGFPTVTGWNDIHMRDCFIEDASQAFEIWCQKAKPGLGFSRCSFTGNRTRNVGGGWGALTRPVKRVAVPLLVYRMETDTVDITVSDNVFEKSPRGLIYVVNGIDSLAPGYRMFRNTVK